MFVQELIILPTGNLIGNDLLSINLSDSVQTKSCFWSSLLQICVDGSLCLTCCVPVCLAPRATRRPHVTRQEALRNTIGRKDRHRRTGGTRGRRDARRTTAGHARRRRRQTFPEHVGAWWHAAWIYVTTWTQRSCVPNPYFHT